MQGLEISSYCCLIPYAEMAQRDVVEYRRMMKFLKSGAGKHINPRMPLSCMQLLNISSHKHDSTDLVLSFIDSTEREH